MVGALGNKLEDGAKPGFQRPEISLGQKKGPERAEQSYKASLFFSFFLSFFFADACTMTGEANGNPPQYCCLENPMDRGAWRATVHGVAKSRTGLKRQPTRTLNQRDEKIAQLCPQLLQVPGPVLRSCWVTRALCRPEGVSRWTELFVSLIKWILAITY